MESPARLVHYFTINAISRSLKLLESRAKLPDHPQKAIFAPETYFRFPEFDFDDFPLPPDHTVVCFFLYIPYCHPFDSSRLSRLAFVLYLQKRNHSFSQM